MEFCFQFCLLQLNIPCTILGAENDMTGEGGGRRRGGVRFGQFKYGQQEQVTETNHNRSTALERSV